MFSSGQQKDIRRSTGVAMTNRLLEKRVKSLDKKHFEVETSPTRRDVGAREYVSGP
jgi:hypothetical protein